VTNGTIGNAALNAALNYAERGIPVFPCNPKDKRPLTKHGFKDATTDRVQISKWWTDNSGAMIGMPTGKATRYLVVDIDPRHSGDVSLLKVMQKTGVTDHLGHKIKTGSGGQHLYYQNDDRFTIGKGDNDIAGIDHRGEGGYVIVPPSTHPSGGFYEGELPDPDSLAPIPEWLAAAILAEVRKPTDTSLKGEPIPEGGRNDALFRIGAKLRAQEWDEEMILDHLLLTNATRCQPPLPEGEVAVIAKQAAKFEKGTEETRAVEVFRQRIKKKVERSQSDSTAPSPPSPEPPSSVSGAIQELSRKEIDELSNLARDVQYTDAGNAEYFVEKYGTNLRYVVETNRWLYWDGTRWREDSSKKFVTALAEQAMRARLVELVNAGTLDEKGEMAKALGALSARRLGAVLELAATRVPVTYYALDSKPYLLNVRNGVLDLRTKELRPHNPNDLMTQIAGVAYNPKAECPRFLKFWGEVLPDITIGYLQRWFGYCLTGENREKKMHIWEGRRGNNGKSITKNLLLHVFGDYTIEVSVSVFIGKNRDYKNDDLVGLKHKRLVFAGEPEDGAILNSSLIKRLTGMDRIHCRPLHSNEWVNYEPKFKPVIITNHEMRVYDTDDAFWRRPEVLRFDQVFEGNADNKNLINELKSESEGVLAWMVNGASEWYEDGLAKDPTVTRETGAYRERQDIFGDFLRSYSSGEIITGYIPGPRWPVPSGRLREYYNIWADREGFKRFGKTKFKEEMERQGYVNYHGEGGAFWRPADDTQENTKVRSSALHSALNTPAPQNQPSLGIEPTRVRVRGFSRIYRQKRGIVRSIVSQKLENVPKESKNVETTSENVEKKPTRIVTSDDDN